jgi:importin subunit alpha-2
MVTLSIIYSHESPRNVSFSRIRNVAEPQNMEVLEAVLWTMSVLCGCKVSFVIIRSMILPVCELVLHHFFELPLDVLIYAVETIMHLSDGNSDQIQAVMDSGITPVLVRLLKGDLPLIKEKSWPLTARVLRCLGNFTTGTEEQTQQVIDAGALAHIGAVINSGSVSLRVKL